MKIMHKVKLFSVAALLFVASCIGLAGINTQNASAASCKDYVYRQSSAYSSCIKNIQTILNGASDNRSSCAGVYDATNMITADGYFGSITNARVKAFQKSRCLSADGIVGANTWGKLCDLARWSGYMLSGPGWYTSSDYHDRIDLATYKAGVYSGCGNSWPYLMNY